MAIAAFLDQKDKKEGFASDAQRRAAFAQGYTVSYTHLTLPTT